MNSRMLICKSTIYIPIQISERPSPMSVEKEILQVTEIKRKPKEDQQRYFERIVNVLAPKQEGNPDFDEQDAAAEKMWANLTENAQAWVDAAIAAIDNGNSIPSFSKYDTKKKATPVQKEVAEEDDEDVENKEEAEEAEEETAEENEEEEKPRKAKASKAVKKEASADDEDLEEEASDQEDDSEGGDKEDDDTQTEQESSMKKPAKKTKGKAKGKGVALASTNGAAKANSTKRPGRASKFNPDMKITVIAKENPRRPNTRTHDVFNYYKTGMTVGAFLEKKDARLVDLKADVDRGHIKVS